MILKPYQNEGAEWLARTRYALLADEMRLGKSVQTIRGALRAGYSRVLVLCPAVARPNWEREFRTWGWPHRVVRLESGRQVVDVSGPVAVLASYEIATSEPMATRLREARWDLLVADECHYLKTAHAKRTYGVYGPEGLARSAHAMWSLSGTPAPNNIAELWPLMRCYGVTDLGYAAFAAEYCYVDHTGKVRGNRPQRTEELRAMLAPVMLRRRKRDVMPDLPPIEFVQQTVEARLDLPKDFAHLANAGEEDVAALLESATDQSSTLRRLLGHAKAAAVADQLHAELAADPDLKVVVFAHHVEVIETLRQRLHDYPFCAVEVLAGATTPVNREVAMRRFQNEPATRAIIVQQTAGGTAIDLSAADHVAFCEWSWVPSDNVQAAARAQGFAKASRVTATMFSVPNSLDDAITRACVRKANDFAAVFDNGVA